MEKKNLLNIEGKSSKILMKFLGYIPRRELKMEIKVNGVKIGNGKPKICVPIVGENMEAILEQAYLIKECSCDLVEWRADWYKNVKDEDATIAVLERLKGVLDMTPIIFTIRTKREGGELEIAFEDYSRILKAVANSGLAELIDVEAYFNKDVPKLIEELKEEGAYVIGSNHNFYETESTEVMCEKLLRISEMGADIPKLAVMPENKDDVVRLLMATYDMSCKLEKPIITMSMGKLGAISRVSGETFGNAVTFASVQKASAPGQISIDTLKAFMELI